jgi:sigma-B regulation protein RsbU (phosphoserine phosphatase)
MALVVSAAGIHAAASFTPDETLAALLESLAPELARTEMYLTVFYGVLDPGAASLTFANAGHAHAFRIRRDLAERLGATAPPLGLAGAGIGRRQVPWSREDDVLCLWTDGLQEARSADGVPFGEERVVASLQRLATSDPDDIVAGVMAEVDAYAPRRGDDRTLLVLRL